jgi:hypothetical protein
MSIKFCDLACALLTNDFQVIQGCYNWLSNNFDFDTVSSRERQI